MNEVPQVSSQAGDRSHILTIGLTDYFQAGALKDVVSHKHWGRFESRLERNTLKTLELLDSCSTKATFFVAGWIAKRQPELVSEVRRRGHEIADQGYKLQRIHEMTLSEFEDDLKRSRDAIETATGEKVLGYRSARMLFSPSGLWILDVLAKLGYAYDSSLFPLFRSFKSQPWRRFPHLHQCGKNHIWEFPLSTLDWFGCMLPIAGGNYFRQFPHFLMKGGVANWIRACDAPFVMYFHVWDLDPEQPRITSASPIVRLRAYRNLRKMPAIMTDYLRTHRFGPVISHIKWDSEPNPLRARNRAQLGQALPELSERELSGPLEFTSSTADVQLPATAVTVVVPCFNEEATLPYLHNTLNSVREILGRKYDLRFVFIDDGSRDGTWPKLNELFGNHSTATLLRHVENRGVTASILTGIRHAETEIVCSIDCDCTYDAHDLDKLIPLLTGDVDLVTGSPYHPLGKVVNVPGWRLSLSTSASFLYRRIFSQKLFTYTSCFRVYRRSVVSTLDVTRGGFLGMPELLAKLDLRGSRIVECPTTLEVRMFGQSKMKIARTVAGHVYLMAGLLAQRIQRRLLGGRPKAVAVLSGDPEVR